jgi:uncharacterized protein YyaL (SSP411 family)
MRRLLLALFCVVFISSQASSAEFRFSPHSNKAGLIKWRSWDAAALEEAKKANKPILLSLSAIWCHWCHVMDETTYSHEDVIRFINENFIPVRVDADMRPDIDAFYNQGGWPSTVVLSAGGDILYGGTYIPVDEMLPWLSRSLALYRELSGSAGKAGNGKKGRVREGGTVFAEKPDISKTISFLKSEFDDRYGGFSGPQKFPNPDAINFLLSEFVRSGDAKAKVVIEKTLDSMADGGIHDRAGGGFFRYATRPDWSAPHYEKMLDLNAQIARNYAFAHQALHKPHYGKIAVEIMEYILKTFFDRPHGMFYGSQDADERYYTSPRRSGLKPPNVDTVLYAGPNARMISALVAVSGATGRVDYVKYAVRTADFMMQKLYSPEDGVSRFYRGGKSGLKGLLEDNALFGLALLDLYNATGEKKYLTVSLQIGRLIAGRFFDSDTNRFRPSLDTTLVQPSEPGTLMEYSSRVAEFHAIELLMRLSRQYGDLKMKEAGSAAVSAMKEGCDKFGPAGGLCGSAIRWVLQEPIEMVVVTRDKPERFLSEANRVFIPEKVVRVFSMEKDNSEIAKLGYPLEQSLYVCSGKKCLASVKIPAEVKDKIERFMKRLASK